LEMITATLDLGRIASGRDVPQMERVDARTLWGALESELAALPCREGVAIRWDDAGDVALLTDRRKLPTIVKNLVGNACKFTASGRRRRADCRDRLSGRPSRRGSSRG